MGFVFFIFTLSAICIVSIIGPPVKEKKPESEANNELFSHIDYAKYLQEVVQALEEDDAFRTKLANASEHEIKSGSIARELAFVSHNVRTKLDELKRGEVERIRHMLRQQGELNQGLDRKQVKVTSPNHLDHRNVRTFEIEDLRKLILQATKDIDEVDKQRREEFKNYEMEKEMERQAQLKQMDEDHRKKAEQEHEEQVQRHKDHPKLHHPGTRDQFKEVWEKEDQLPSEEFDLRTFFRMHDIDGDGHWDMNEVKAIFRNELNKMYNPNMTEDDMKERMEEMERMREHVFGESDTNKDGAISYKEFIDYSKRREFEEDPGWKGLDEQPQYTKEEYEEYEKMRQAELAEMAAQGINPWGGPNYIPQGPYEPMPPHMQGQMPPNYHHNQQGYQQMPQHQQQGYQQMPQHQQQYQQVPQQQQYQQLPQQHQQFQQVPQQQYQQVPQQQYQQVPTQNQQVPIQNQELPSKQEPTQQQQQHNQVNVEQRNPETQPTLKP